MKTTTKLFTIFTVFVMLFSMICIPVLADDITPENDYTFDDSKIAIYSASEANELNYNNMTEIVSGTTNTGDFSISYSADTDNVYCYAVKTSANTIKINACSASPFNVYRVRRRDDLNGHIYYGDYYTNTGVYWSNTNIYSYEFNTAYSLENYSCSCPIFLSSTDGRQAFRYFLDNPSSSLPDSGYFSLNLNPGYVAFIDITDLTGVSVSLDTTLFGGSDWNNHQTDQNIGLLNSMPSSFSLPIAGTNHINWSGTGNKNILGQYKSFKANYTYSTVGNTTYLVIVNPLQARMDAQLTAMASMPSQRNNPIFITVSQARTCKIYSLTASLAVGSGNLDIESNGETYSGTNDGEGNWTYTNDETGSLIDPDTLPIGGGNDPIIGQETSINDWLQNIANQIKGFFSGAIGAVTTLVSAGSAFINSLVGLYSWLPAPVYTVLSAALTIVITVGVIKVFI